jgi:hypothetical protein
MTGRLKTVNKTNFYKARAKQFFNFSYKEEHAIHKGTVVAMIMRVLQFDSAKYPQKHDKIKYYKARY